MSSGSFVAHKFAFIRQVTFDTALPAVPARVAVVLAEFMNAEKGYAWPSIVRLAEIVGVTENTVRAALRRLVAAGHITVETGGGKGHANRYRWLLRAAADEAGAAGEADQIDDAGGAKPCNALQGIDAEPCNGLHPLDGQTLQSGVAKPCNGLQPTKFKEQVYRGDIPPPPPNR